MAPARHIWGAEAAAAGQNGNGNLHRKVVYTKSLVNTNLVNTNFANTHFQKVPIPHLTRTMKQKFLH